MQSYHAKKPNARPSWYFCGKDGWNVGVYLEHYPCQLIFAKDTNAVQVSYTVEFRHQYLTQPTLPHADRILHGMKTLSFSLKYAPTITCDAQLGSIKEIREIFKRWINLSRLTTVPPRPKPKVKYHGKRRKSHIPPITNTRIPLTPPSPRVPNLTTDAQYPRVHFLGVTALTPRVEA